MAADSFPQDVLELQGYLADETRVPTIHATPGRGTHVPIYILGSSLFGAQLAAMLGLPYAFASHFAPGALAAALRMYRSEFQPSEQLAEPYAIAAVNVIAAPTREEAEQQRAMRRRALGRRMLTRGGHQLDDSQIDAILDSPDGSFVDEMMTYTACGTPDDVRAYLEDFQRFTAADELMTVHQGGVVDDRILSLTLTAKVMDLGE
jgi:luciferase family oxidoreductase group 1